MLSSILLVLLSCGQESAVPSVGDTASSADAEAVFVPYAEDGDSVEAVDPERYLGLWYEIATTPSQQQAYCSGTTAEYALIDEETIGVTNRCYIGDLDGNLNEIEATARPLDETFARLMVDFGFGFEAPYTVVDLVDPGDGSPYLYAAVNSIGTQYWILSRTPQIPEDVYATLLERIDERGGDSSELIPTEQPELDDDSQAAAGD